MALLPKNVVIVIALLAAGFFAAYLRFRPHLGYGSSYTDGSEQYSGVQSDGIRFAVWDDPQRVGPAADGEHIRATASPDGRLLVFASGARGLNVELYAAELIDGRPHDPQPLHELNSGFDDATPAFGADALYFSSDRPGGEGGTDLYRVSYSAGAFGIPENLGPDVNSASDETDPAPFGEGVAFASNRPRGLRTDYDLFFAGPAPAAEIEASFAVEPLESLNSGFDERDPSFTADGRVLVFASDREESVGAYDLFRSLRDGLAWLPPDPLSALNSSASERGPDLSADGFSLLYSTEDTSGYATLLRARSLELFRRPGRPVGWLDLLILGSLLLLALLAYLAKRWKTLEIVYKCFLISAVLHLILLWYLQRVYVEGSPADIEGDSPLFQVQLALNSSGSDGGNMAREGQLETTRTAREDDGQPARREVESNPIEAEASQAQLETAERTSEAPAPQRTSLQPDRPAESAIPEVAVNAGSAEFEKQSGEAPSVVVVARPINAARSESSARNAPTRAVRQSSPSASTDAPTQHKLARQSHSADRPAPTTLARGPERTDPVRSARHVQLANPSEETQRLAGEAPALALPEPQSTDRASRAGSGEPQLARRESRESARSGGDQVQAPSEPASVAVATRQLDRPSTPRRRRPTRNKTAQRSTAGVELRQPASEPVDIASQTRETPGIASTPVAGNILALPAPSATRRDRAQRTNDGPRELQRANRRRSAPVAPKPTFTPLVAAAEPAPTTPGREAQSVQPSPYQTRFGEEKLRALEIHGGSDETEQAVADGLAYLASIQSESGHWGRRNRREDKYHYVHIGKTGLAALTFLGAGHTPRSETRYSAVVGRAIDYLLSVQSDGFFGYNAGYSHAIATYALAECHALTKDTRLTEPLNRAVEVILAHQDKRSDRRVFGGWSYYYPDGRTFDSWPRVSVTAWQVMALESARLGGIEVPDQTFDDALSFLLGAYDRRREAFRYSHDPNRLRSGYPILPGSTPAALFVLSLLGADLNDEALRDPFEFVTQRAPSGYESRGSDAFVFDAVGNLYFWYYGTLALFRKGGSEWDRWNTSMTETLLGSQSEDGSWRPISHYAELARDTDEDRTYSTSMCVLTLEIYYRYFTPLLKVK